MNQSADDYRPKSVARVRRETTDAAQVLCLYKACVSLNITPLGRSTLPCQLFVWHVFTASPKYSSLRP